MLCSITRLSRRYAYSLLKLALILCGCLLALRSGWAVQPLYGVSIVASPNVVFQLVEHFDGLGIGALDGQNGWHATGGVTVASDPENAANRVMAIAIGDFQAYKALPTVIDNASSSSTLHFRLRRNGHMDGFGGLSDLAAPNDWTSYETQFGAQVTQAADAFVARDGAQFDAIGSSFNDQTWYCVWLVTNNASDTYQVYAKGGAFAQPTQLNAGGQTVFGFRNGGSDPLLTFLARANNTSQGSFYLDDIYVDATSQNLSTPSNNCGAIASTSGWQQTSLTLQPGNQFNVAYTGGTWTVDVRSLSYVGPDGYTPADDNNIALGCKVDDNYPYAMLLGQVGNGAIFPVGLGGTFTANASGALALRINDLDGCLGDNSGSIGVVITNIQIPPPSPNFDAWPQNGMAPLISSMHIVDISNITSCIWDYGDGTAGASCAGFHDHTYTSAGTYTVKLTVFGPGGSNSLTRSNYITVIPPTNQLPTVAIISPAAGATAVTGSTVQIDAIASDANGTVTQVAFFANGVPIANCVDTSVPYQCSWTPTTPGVYNLTAQATDNLAATALSAVIAVTVNQPPIANFSANPLTGTNPLTVNFTDQSTGSITSWVWSFGDGGTSTQQNPVHVYNTVGSYTVALTVSGPAGTNTKTMPNYIQVPGTPNPPPTVSINSPAAGTTVLTGSTVQIGAIAADDGTVTQVAFFANGAPIANCVDTTSPYGCSWTPTTPGVYNLTAQATDNLAVTTLSPAVAVTVNQPVTANFSANTTTGSKPLTVTFTDQSTGSITSWAWNFGDGGTSTQQSPLHVYNTAGNYTVALTVSGPGGSNTKTQTNYIQVSELPAPTANFSASPTSGEKPLSVTFTDQSTGNITSWAWNFGDNGTSTQQNPVHVYANAGDYTVSLTVSGPTGSNTKTMANHIQVSEPHGLATPSLSSIANPDQDGNYTIVWPTIANVTSYELQEQANNGNWTTIYKGPNVSYNLTGKAAGTWCYHIRLNSVDSSSEWSNSQCTVVASNGPSLTLPEKVLALPGSKVVLPVTYAANGNNISVILFSINYDQTKLSFNPQDSNGDRIPDVIQFGSAIPVGFVNSVSFDVNDTNGELDFVISDFSASPRAILNGTLVSIALDVLASSPVEIEAPISFDLSSFGGASGDVQGVTDDGSVFVTAQLSLYLPLIRK